MRWRVALLALGIAAAALQSSSAPKPVEFLRTAKFIFDNDPFGFQVRVIPSAEYRLLRVAALNETGDTARSSDEQLDGLEARTTRLIQWDALEAGHYTLIARVYNETGAACARTAEYWGSCKSLASATSTLEVRGFSQSYSPFDDPQ